MQQNFVRTLSLILIFCAITLMFPVFAVTEPAMVLKKMTMSEDKIYVLHQESYQLVVFDFKAQQIQKLILQIPSEYRHKVPSDIAFHHNQLYLSYFLVSDITVHNTQGKYLKTLQPQMKHHEGVTSLLFTETGLLAGTAGYIMILEDSGQVRNIISMPSHSSGLSGLITDLSYCNGTLFALDSTHQEIHLFHDAGKGEAYTYAESIGGYGMEVGRFMHLKGISAKGKVYTAEFSRESFQEIHLLSRDSLIRNLPKGVPFATDILVIQDRIFLCTANSEQLFSFSLFLEKNYPEAIITSKFIDFGTVPLTPNLVHHFSILSPSGYPAEGSIQADHPAFTVYPSDFSGVQVRVAVALNPAELKAESDYQGKLTVKLTDGHEHTISLRAHIGQKQDFQIILPECPMISSDAEPLLIRIDPQNKLQDDFSVIVTSQNIPFRFVQKNALHWEIQAIGQPHPAFYTLSFQVRSPVLRLVKQSELTFLYRNPKGSLPGSVLGEYFAADWCRFCPSGHKALLELREKYATDAVNFVTYYNDCLEDTPVRLCFPGAESRMRWYVPTGTHVSMFFNGDHPIHGGINAPDATMTDTYQERIQTLLSRPRSISLMGIAKVHSSFYDDDTLHIGASIIKTTDVEYHDLRLIALIAENKITWSVTTGQTEHNFVARKFLDYINPEMDPAYGKKIIDSDSKRFDIHLFTRLDPLIKLENAYGILMVQDRQTREIYQSRYLSLEPFKEVRQISLRQEKEVFHLSKKEDNLLTFYIQNRGNAIEQCMFKLDSTLAFPESARIIIGKNTYETSSSIMFDLNPMEVLTFKLFLPAEQDYPEKSFLNIKVYSSQNYSLETYMYSSDRPLPRYQVLFPPSSTKNESESFQTSLSLIPFWIKTEPETLISGIEEKKASAEGNLFFYRDLFPGLNLIQLTLLYPDQSQEIVQIPVFRKLMLLLTIGSQQVHFNDSTVYIDAPPYISKGRTMVPLRFISETFNAHISYEATNRTISISYREKKISLQIGSSIAKIDHVPMDLDVPPEITNGRTFVPLRFIAELFDTRVEWDNVMRQVRISTDNP